MKLNKHRDNLMKKPTYGYKITKSSEESKELSNKRVEHIRKAKTCPECGYCNYDEKKDNALPPFGAYNPYTNITIAIMKCPKCGCEYEYSAPADEVIRR